MQLIQDMDLNDIQIFCKAAESKNFTDASIAIGVTPSAVSKAVSRLEKKLNIKLFERSTRSMRLTEEGKSYYQVCKESVENIRDIERQITNSIEPCGILRISMPDSYGIKKFLPNINEFLERHSDGLHVEVSLSNAYVNFTKDEFDLAIRIGRLKEERLIAKPLHSATLKLVASPAYLKKYGEPKTLEALHQHKCVGLRFPHTGQVMPWEFLSAPSFHFKPSLIHSDSLGAFESVLHGFGIMQFFDYAVDSAIAEGRVVELFPEERPDAKEIHLIYPSSRYVPAKVRLFMDYLFKKLGE